MGFGHEKLDAYRAAIEYVGWAYRLCEALKERCNAKDQLLRVSQAIPFMKDYRNIGRRRLIPIPTPIWNTLY
jgi:hypothetical protein